MTLGQEMRQVYPTMLPRLHGAFGWSAENYPRIKTEIKTVHWTINQRNLKIWVKFNYSSTQNPYFAISVCVKARLTAIEWTTKTFRTTQSTWTNSFIGIVQIQIQTEANPTFTSFSRVIGIQHLHELLTLNQLQYQPTRLRLVLRRTHVQCVVPTSFLQATCQHYYSLMHHNKCSASLYSWMQCWNWPKKNWGFRCQNVLNFAQGLKFKTDFHSKMSVCRHELWGFNLSPPPIPGNFNPGWM